MEPAYFFPIDLEKARNAPVSHYALRLMVATNDLVTCRHLAKAIDYDRSEEEAYLRNLNVNALMYVMRMQESHLVEIYDGLIHPVLEPQNHKRARATSVQTYVYSRPKVKEKFDSAAFLLSHPLYAKLQKVRNRIGFHYDVDGRIFKQALAIHAQDLEKRDEKIVGYIQMSRDEKNTHLLHMVGSEVLQTLWRQLLGNLPDIDDYSEDTPTQEVKDFITSLGKTFLSFADTFLSEWTLTNHLKGKAPLEVHSGGKNIRMIWGY